MAANKKKLVFTPEQEQEIVRIYQKGERVDAIAARLMVSATPIYFVLRKAKVVRGKGRIPGTKREPKPVLKPTPAPTPVVEPVKLEPKPVVKIEPKPLPVMNTVSTLKAAELLDVRPSEVEAIASCFFFRPLDSGVWNQDHIDYIKLLRDLSRDPKKVPVFIERHQKLFGQAKVPFSAPCVSPSVELSLPLDCPNPLKGLS